MLRRSVVAFLGFAPFWVSAADDDAAKHADLVSRVVIVANASDPESLQLAAYYREKRGIPADNVIALPMSKEETISWKEYVETVSEPLRAELIKRKWVDSFDTTRKDKLGRKIYPISGHRISYLVTCRGVPLRVGPGYELYHEQPPPLLDQPEFRTNQGAVDAELSLVVRNDYRINGFIPNPLFGKDRATFVDLNGVVKVARLDGPTLASALNLVDGALAAETNGLIGRAYVDIGGGPYARGEDWFKAVAKLIETLPFDFAYDQEQPLLPVSARFDAPALYFAWHSPDINGPALQPEFRFPPGAIALHLHSFSAYTVRGDRAGWCGPLVARGVAATFGNVFEPYLELTHRPDMLLQALLRGDNLGDATYFALRAVSWHQIVLGDPLYRPFKVRFAEQWAARDRLPPELNSYVVLSEVCRLDKEGQSEKAIELARERLRQNPSFPIALKLANVLMAAGRKKEVKETLSWISSLAAVKPNDAALAVEAAELQSKAGQTVDSVATYQRVLALQNLPKEMRQRTLELALKAAEASRDKEQAKRWADEAAQLNGKREGSGG